MAEGVTACDADAVEWVTKYMPELDACYQYKALAEDSETGAMVRLMRYPAGFLNKRHDHPCAHGMYVLSGVLRTSEGDFGPGSFVWFPEGTVMWHGAAADQAVEFLFFTNKKFGIRFL
jgi:quercetin dioxygenase-like cupin family protein